jgi:hypothetical protein
LIRQFWKIWLPDYHSSDLILHENKEINLRARDKYLYYFRRPLLTYSNKMYTQHQKKQPSVCDTEAFKYCMARLHVNHYWASRFASLPNLEFAHRTLQLFRQALQTRNVMTILFYCRMILFRHLRDLFDIARDLGAGDTLLADRCGDVGHSVA